VPWKPSLDTDIDDFLETARINKKARRKLRKIYNDFDKKTFRELIEMPYEWFINMCYSDEEWKLLQKELRKYEIKLYKKGNVTDD